MLSSVEKVDPRVPAASLPGGDGSFDCDPDTVPALLPDVRIAGRSPDQSATARACARLAGERERTLPSVSHIVRRSQVVSITHGRLWAAGEGKPPGFREVSPPGADDA